MADTSGTSPPRFRAGAAARAAETLVPVLRERAPQAEELRRCPDETVADFAAAGFLRICQPARFGGYEQPGTCCAR